MARKAKVVEEMNQNQHKMQKEMNDVLKTVNSERKEFEVILTKNDEALRNTILSVE